MAPILKACVRCGLPSPDSYCADHKPDRSSYRRDRMGLSGGAWETLRRKVLARDMGCCYLCGRDGADEVDHLFPVWEGGSNELTNLASAHRTCHARRHGEPAWAAERVAAALDLLAELAGVGGDPETGEMDQARWGASRAPADSPDGAV